MFLYSKMVSLNVQFGNASDSYAKVVFTRVISIRLVHIKPRELSNRMKSAKCECEQNTRESYD